MSRRLRVVRDFGGGRIRGLPGPLPPGETMLWQGAPDAAILARRVLHVRKIAVYFTVLALWCAGSGAWRGSPRLGYSAVALLVLGALAISLLYGFAWMVARTTVYTLTDRRLVLRIGVALSMSINLPFCMIESAQARLYPEGHGDLPVRLSGPNRIGFTLLWPHVRPWHLRSVEPMLRAVPDAARVAQLLSRALAAEAGQAVPATPLQPEPARETVHGDWPASVGA